MLGIVFASVFLLSLLSLVVYYSNEILEDDLLARQTEFELRNIEDLLAQDSDADLPSSANLEIYLASRAARRPIPDFLRALGEGVHHDIKIDDKAYHVIVVKRGPDRIYIQTDITEIERSEELLGLILLIAWIAMIVLVFVIARILSKRLSGPIAQLSQDLSRINPNQRGVRLGDNFADDEVGRIAQAFDSYSAKMDGYVEKQMAFAAMASHELRSPLTIVQTSADLIASRHPEAEIKPHLDKIRRASANMTNMIHALLAVTRDQSSRNRIESIYLRPVVDEILDSLSAEIETKQIDIDNRVDADAEVEADRTLLTVVLSNLIRNSVKHGRQSSIVIEMQDGQLAISDSGLGIDREALAHIFEFGFRGKGSEGYGVGLYISKLICDYQGWTLCIEANGEKGTLARIAFAV